jgi:hypothetical protein
MGEIAAVFCSEHRGATAKIMDLIKLRTDESSTVHRES